MSLLWLNSIQIDAMHKMSIMLLSTVNHEYYVTKLSLKAKNVRSVKK